MVSVSLQQEQEIKRAEGYIPHPLDVLGDRVVELDLPAITTSDFLVYESEDRLLVVRAEIAE